MNYSDNLKLGEKGVWLSIMTYLFLAIIKIFIAYVGNSEALRADGLNNATDVVASVAILLGLKISRKPPDQDHHYGHGRAETVASLFAAFIMMIVGLQVTFNTFRQLIENEVTQPNMLTAWTALGAALVMLAVYRFNVRLAKKINNRAVYAAAQDNKSDALVSIGAFIGIIGSQFGIFWLDPLAGFVVGILICLTAWKIFKDSTHTLTDGFDETKIEKIKASIAKVDEVKEVKDVKGRVYGNQEFIDITIFVDPHLNVEESHNITIRIEKLLAKKYNIPYAHIHIEPYEA